MLGFSNNEDVLKCGLEQEGLLLSDTVELAVGSIISLSSFSRFSSATALQLRYSASAALQRFSAATALQRRYSTSALLPRFSAATALQCHCRAVFPRLDLARVKRHDAALAEVKRTAADGTRTTDWKQPVVVARLSPYTIYCIYSPVPVFYGICLMQLWGANKHGLKARPLSHEVRLHHQ